MKSSNWFVIAAVALALGGCNRPNENRTTSIPPRVDAAEVTQPLVTPSAPPAPPQRGPIPPDANAAAPGTNASLAFADASDEMAAKSPPSKGGSPDAQHVNVAAQEAAAKAPDTAAADAAKRKVRGESSNGGATARDTAANSPRHGALTKQQESTEMPKAGQANNHSSTALDKDSAR